MCPTRRKNVHANSLLEWLDPDFCESISPNFNWHPSKGRSCIAVGASKEEVFLFNLWSYIFTLSLPWDSLRIAHFRNSQSNLKIFQFTYIDICADTPVSFIIKVCVMWKLFWKVAVKLWFRSPTFFLDTFLYRQA